MIDRDSLTNNTPLKLFGPLIGQKYLTDTQLVASLSKMLASRAENEPVWVFAYGSLLWNPVIQFAERKKGYVKDCARAFCMKLVIGRGTPQNPGRMLGLIPGDGVHGIFLRISNSALIEELGLLWKREMSIDGYNPVWTKAELDDGRTITALAFMMSSKNALHDPRVEPTYVARFIADAEGPLGTNREYLEKLFYSLHVEGIRDDYITQVMEAVDALRDTLPADSNLR